MIDVEEFGRVLKETGIDFAAGVPDSLLKDFCAYVADSYAENRHVITANEGAAVATAAGYHMATGKVPMVYLQNSGQGNTLNPLTSLADPEVYGIPMVIFVGWRGEPGRSDEPQHMKQGRCTPAIFDAIGVRHLVLPGDFDEACMAVRDAYARAKQDDAPIAILVPSGAFGKYKSPKAKVAPYEEMKREDAIEVILESLPSECAMVSTTGKASREVFEVRKRAGQSGAQDFLTVGSMGHASAIALGINLGQPTRPIVCLDGDGALLMHMGSLPVAASLASPAFKHIVINNGAHESVGGQPTVADRLDLVAIARACGYAHAERASNLAQLRGAMPKLMAVEGPAFLEVQVSLESRSDLGRPDRTPAQAKAAFMEFLRS